MSAEVEDGRYRYLREYLGDKAQLFHFFMTNAGTRLMQWLVAAISLAMVMFVALVIWAALTGDIRAEMGVINDLPWGVVALVDVYLGLMLVAAWVAYREHSWFAILTWIVALSVLGNAVTCAYVLYAYWQSGGDPTWFWSGVNGQQDSNLSPRAGVAVNTRR